MNVPPPASLGHRREQRSAANRTWRHRVGALLGLTALCVGCIQPPGRGMLQRDELVTFSEAAVKALQEAALGDEPALRMNAIETLAEVAPAEGLPFIELNIENDYAGASFAALMALGHLKNRDYLERIRTRAEHANPNVRIAALYALHRLGERQRTTELADFLLNNRDARVRANAALAIGRLGEPSAAKVLHQALRREQKDLPKLQILEALAIMGDKYATERLIFAGYSAYPDQAASAIMFLANARSQEAEDLFRYRLGISEHPEVRLQAARGLGRLGDESGLDLAIAYLWFNSPATGQSGDPPEQQTRRVRGLAALALEAIGNPEALKSLKAAFELEGQQVYVRLAIARAALSLMSRGPGQAGDRLHGLPAQERD